MANRVLLDEQGLRISRPGVDVLTAGLGGLQFSSIGTHVPVYTSGTVSRSSAGEAVHYFGKTFPGAPLVTWWSSTGIGGQGPAAFYENPTFGNAIMEWLLFIYSDRLVYRTGQIQSGTLNFKVWDFG